ncbi:hypothetical protein BHE74_00039257 [Ensete ventricosum]|uniref:Uncharacterized protein n=1 Tax=Ensete ventricosum TaxID=4639 RepID=A0A444EUG2_ENSVE|nr:hypothetical protein B296_00008659 [Ensete ventricosum]RWW14004.1 hypothetical protein GW17_00022258 [Ensete ventricosum]RWW54170.1 hypothetical protein BHE74_00039257 [Ensete ventricosum]RZS15310.1 hypothetical protein BHM03_00047125 [Ensete ventricosum]
MNREKKGYKGESSGVDGVGHNMSDHRSEADDDADAEQRVDEPARKKQLCVRACTWHVNLDVNRRRAYKCDPKQGRLASRVKDGEVDWKNFGMLDHWLGVSIACDWPSYRLMVVGIGNNWVWSLRWLCGNCWSSSNTGHG